jgi:TonB family protein
VKEKLMRVCVLVVAASWLTFVSSGVASAQTPVGPIYKASDGVSLPVPLKKVEPRFLADAQKARTQGTVIVDCVVLPDGTVGDVRVTQSLDPSLDEEAVRAVREWRFRPGRREGQAVPVLVAIEMGFALREPPYKPGNGVSLPVPVKQVKPRYPEEAQNAGVQGVVTLETVVLADGSVGRTTVLVPLDPALRQGPRVASEGGRQEPRVLRPGRDGGRPTSLLRRHLVPRRTRVSSHRTRDDRKGERALLSLEEAMKIPDTDSIRELADFWDTHEVTAFDDQLEEVAEPVFTRARNGVTVRLSRDELTVIRRIAASRGVDEAALIHEWVQEKLHH